MKYQPKRREDEAGQIRLKNMTNKAKMEINMVIHRKKKWRQHSSCVSSGSEPWTCQEKDRQK